MPAPQRHESSTAEVRQLEANRDRTPFYYHLVTKGADVLRTIFRVTGVVIGMYLLKEMVVPFAGTQSEANLSFLVQVVAQLGMEDWLQALAVIGTSSWAVVERWLRRRYIRRHTGRIKELEERVDPNRSSSGITDKGLTRPED